MHRLRGAWPREVPVDPDAPEARDWLVRELANPEYEAARPTWFDLLAQRVVEWFESLRFTPGEGGYPVFKTRYGTIGVYICYDRHFPEGARLLGLHGAEVVFNPSATVAGLSQYLWKLEQPAHAVANGYFMACSNRVGTEQPWDVGRFYGSSYFVDPRGNFIAEASEDQDELITAELDLDLIEEVRRTWQFYRDRRPETYQEMIEHLP